MFSRKEKRRSAPEKAVAMSNNGSRNGTLCELQESALSAGSVSEADGPQWFAIAVKPRFDKSVAKALEGKGFETLVPLYKKQHRYAGRSKESELPLFPGYVFSRFHVRVRLPILTTPGVTQILGNGNRPIPLSETEIASLKTAIEARVLLQPFPFLQVGQRVRIDEGALAGVVGIVIRLKQPLRLVLSVTLLQRSVLLEIDGHQVNLEPEFQTTFRESGHQSFLAR
jgi:transcription antitermination factor NusG